VAGREVTIAVQVKIGCELVFNSSHPTPLLVQVQPRPDGSHQVVQEASTLEPLVDSHEYLDSFGNRCLRFRAPQGGLRFCYDAVADISPEPDQVVPHAAEMPPDQLPDEVLMFTLPSRYVVSDQLSNVAWDLFGQVTPGWSRVQAICDWVHQHINFRAASTTPTTTVLDVYLQRYGVCRDFAHMGITMCRALNIPARYVSGYLPDIGIKPPDLAMDFHSWFEAYLDGRWLTFDARHNTPRIGRIPIGRGRDAVDVAIITQYGPAQLDKFTVWADEVKQASPTEAAVA
jgi:transglutaminase-like putative cysteine protease